MGTVHELRAKQADITVNGHTTIAAKDVSIKYVNGPRPVSIGRPGMDDSYSARDTAELFNYFRPPPNLAQALPHVLRWVREAEEQQHASPRVHIYVMLAWMKNKAEEKRAAATIH